MKTLDPTGFTPADVEKLEEVASSLSPQAKGLIREIADYVRSGETIYLLHKDEELTPNEAAERLKMSRTHLCKLLDRGEIPFRKVGTHRRILVSDLVAFNEKRHAAQLELAERFAHHRETTAVSNEALADLL